MNERQTNIDVDLLAHSELVRAFLRRVIDEERDALTGHVFAVKLAKRAADAFELHYEDRTGFPKSLMEIAEEVIRASDARHGTAR